MVSQEILHRPDRPVRLAQRAPGAAVGIGASAGGLTALDRLFSKLPADIKAPIFVVLHIGDRPSEFPYLLARHSAMPCRYAHDGERVQPGHIYIAPPDCHMIVEQDHVRLTRGPRENWARPSIDVLFRSLAWEYGDCAIGVILTGGLHDGTAGLYEIKRHGGVALVQDPSDAEMPSMPQSALDNVKVDHRLPLEKISSCLAEIANGRCQTKVHKEGGSSMQEGSYRQDEPVAMTCPACGGALKPVAVGKLMQYRCHIGHAFSAEDVAASQIRAVESSLETALRVLNENRTLSEQLAEQAGEKTETANAWKQASSKAQKRMRFIQSALEKELD